MSRRVLLVGQPDDLRARIAAALDASFDVDIEQEPDVLASVSLLPSRSFDLFVVLADGGAAPGIDLVRLLREHQRHSGVPVLFAGGTAGQRQAALALGAALLSEDSSDGEIQQLAREALALG